MLTNGPVHIDFHATEFALRRAGSQTATSAEPGAFADYLASVLNPSRQDPYGVPERRSDDAARAAYDERQRPDEPGSRTKRSSESTRAEADYAATQSRPPADRPPEKSAAAPESPDDARAVDTRSKGTPTDGTPTGEEKASEAGLEDTRADGEAANGPHSDGSLEDGGAGRGRSGAVEADGPRLASRPTEGRDGRAAGRKDAEESQTGHTNLRDGETGGPAEVRFDRHGRPFVELDVEMDGSGRARATGANDGGRASPSTNAAGTFGAGAQEAFAEAGGTGVRARLRAGDGDARENEDTRDGRGARRVEVRDLRGRAAGRPDSGDTTGQGRDGSSDTTAAFDRSALRPPGAVADASSGDGLGDGGSSADSSVHTVGTPTTARGSGPPSPGQASAHADASAHLRQALHEHLNGDIVRAARLVIRNRDSGEIRLHLKPESLGSVRISLQMQDGHIAGRIIVDNQTVREAFEQNLASLQRAFQESGLEASGVEVSVADSGGRQDGGGETGGQTASRTVADHFGQVVPDFEWFEEQHELVDMVV